MGGAATAAATARAVITASRIRSAPLPDTLTTDPVTSAFCATGALLLPVPVPPPVPVPVPVPVPPVVPVVVEDFELLFLFLFVCVVVPLPVDVLVPLQFSGVPTFWHLLGYAASFSRMSWPPWVNVGLLQAP